MAKKEKIMLGNLTTDYTESTDVRLGCVWVLCFICAHLCNLWSKLRSLVCQPFDSQLCMLEKKLPGSSDEDMHCQTVKHGALELTDVQLTDQAKSQSDKV